MTLDDVAKGSDVSDATVLRFVRSIGYRRWLDFKISLTQSLANPPEQILDEVNEDDPPAVIAKKVFQCSISALNDTITVMDEKSFEAALDLIIQADKILIIGVGTSGPMAHEMYNRLLRLGLNCHVQTDSYIQVMETALLTPEDLVIVFSQTGDSRDPLRTASLAKSNGCSILVITGNQGSKLTEYADVVLLSVSHETRIETIASRIAQYAIIHALFVGIAMRDISGTLDKERSIWEAMMNKPYYQSL